MPSSLLTPAYTVTLGNQRWTTQAIGLTVVLDAAPAIDRAVVDVPGRGARRCRDRRPRRHRARCRRRRRSDRRAHRHRPRHHPRRAHDHGRVHRRRRRPRRLPPGDVVRTDVGRQRGAGAVRRRRRRRGAGRHRADPDGLRRRPHPLGPRPHRPLGRLERRPGVDRRRRPGDHAGRRRRPARRRPASRPRGAAHQPAHRRRRNDLRRGRRGGRRSAAPPDAARPTSDFFAGDRPDGPGVGTRWSFEPALRTPDAAAVAGAARGRTAGSLRHRTTLDAWLVPALRPGTVVRLDELPDGLAAGPHWVERVVHRVGPGGATTSARLAEAGRRLRPARPARLARRRGREPAVSGTNVPLLVQTVRGLARDEVLARWTTAAAVVRSVHGGTEHACTVQLRETGLVLPRVPIAVGVLGLVALPNEGDLVARRLQRRRRARRRGRRPPVRRGHGAARPRPRPGRVEPARRRDRRRLPPPADGRRARRRDALGRR